MKRAIKFRIIRLSSHSYRLEYRQHFRWKLYSTCASVERCEAKAREYFLANTVVKTFWVFKQ